MLAHYTNYKYATFLKIHELKDKKEDHEFEQKKDHEFSLIKRITRIKKPTKTQNPLTYHKKISENSPNT